jgi:hypothetical protein
MLRFKELLAKSDVGIAVVIFGKRVPREVWPKLIFAHWQRIFFIAMYLKDSPLVGRAATEMCRTAKTFENWHSAYSDFGARPKLREQAFQGMTQTASTFKHWLTIYYSVQDNPGVKRAAAEKMMELARTFDDWHSACLNLKPDSRFLGKAQNHMEATAVTLKDWLSVYCRVSSPQKQRRALRRVLAAARTFEELLFAYNYTNFPEVKRAVFRRIRRMPTSLDQLLELSKQSKLSGRLFDLYKRRIRAMIS